MLRDTSELTKNAVTKDLIISKVILKEILKFLLRHWFFGLGATLLFMPLLDYCLTKKQSNKNNSVWLVGSGSFEIILTFLAEAIAI